MPDFSQLTDKQRQIYDFIEEQIDQSGYPPTVREICEHFAIKSPNGVMCHLKALERKGLIQRKGNSARALQLTDHRRRSSSGGLPFRGVVAAGAPLPAVEQDEQMEFDTLFAGPRRFVLQVRGRSMIDDHIDDGDYVVIQEKSLAENGERVVAMVDGDVTLKRFYREGDHIRLEPSNPEMEPILVHDDQDAHILGILVGVIRKC